MQLSGLAVQTPMCQRWRDAYSCPSAVLPLATTAHAPLVLNIKETILHIQSH